MGYTITIGELSVMKKPDDGLDSPCISFGAIGIRHDDAPAFGDPTDYTNSRWPSYTVWADFARATGLYDVLFYGGTLIGGHPGVRLVTKELVDRVALELEVFKKRYPNAEPKYDETDESSYLCRLIWLDYWLRWSFEYCETPVIVNS